MKVLVPMAPGFEEIEAITIIDVLRRASIDVITAYLETNPVKGSHNIAVTADTAIEKVRSADFRCIVLPGGMPGSENLRKNQRIIDLIRDILSSGGFAAAICAAPMVLGFAGVLKGKNATCFPGFENHMTGAHHLEDPVIVDGNILTGRGPGCAIPFSLKLVEMLKDVKTSEELKKSMQVYWM